MPMEKRFLQQGKLLLVFFIVSLTLLMSFIGILMVNNQKKVLSHEENKQAQLEVTLITEFIQDSLIRHDYAEIREFLDNWGKTRANVLMLNASFNNGFELLSYKSADYSSKAGITITRNIEFGDNTLMIEIVKNAVFVDNIINRFKYELLIEAFMIIVLVGLALWYVLTKYSITPMEKRAVAKHRCIGGERTAIQKCHIEYPQWSSVYNRQPNAVYICRR